MLALIFAVVAVTGQGAGAGSATVERLKPLGAAVGDAHRHAIGLSRAAAELPATQLEVAGDDEHEVYVALVDADLELTLLADDPQSPLSRASVTTLRSELALAREALGDYTAARADNRRTELREAAEALRGALGRAGAVIDAAREAPPSE